MRLDGRTMIPSSSGTTASTPANLASTPSSSRSRSIPPMRKKDPAALRTIGLFSGKTPLEEASAMLEEAEDAKDARLAPQHRDLGDEANEMAVKWLGLDMFAEGDDVRVAVHAKGHAVIVLVDKSGNTKSFGLSKTQWAKLRSQGEGGAVTLKVRDDASRARA